MKSVPTLLPTAVLVGRANVGKSTLFNHLTETHKAMISKVAGTTRDRKEGAVAWRGRMFRLVDTGGLDFDRQQPFEEEIRRQTTIAMEMADVIVFVTDAKGGMLPQDLQIAKHLRRTKTPVLVVANKAEGRHAIGVTDAAWFKTGLEAPRPVSAVRGNGLGDLLDELFTRFDLLGRSAPDRTEDAAVPRIAFIGEPNVGKSSIINAILGEERFITSPIAHTTREPNDTLVEANGHRYIIVDTAGIRRKSSVERGVERSGVLQTLNLLKHVDIAVLVLDAGKELDHQEKKLAGLIEEAGVGCVIVVNKWDVVKEKGVSTENERKAYVFGHLPFLTFAPLLTTSAKFGQRIPKLFPLFDKIMEERSREITENALDKFLRQMIMRHKPARGKGVAHPTIFRLKQTGTHPPAFELVIKGSRTDVLHPSYLRFMENRLREKFGFQGTPIKLYVLPSRS